MAFVISSNAPYVSFIIIATNITIIRKKNPRHCYVITINRAIGCQCHVAARYRLILDWMIQPLVLFIKIKGWIIQSSLIEATQLAIAPHCFAVDVFSPFHWSPTNFQYLFIIITKGMSIQCTKSQHRRYSQTNTLITVYVCTRQPVTHLPHFPRSDDENMTSEWHCSNVADGP